MKILIVDDEPSILRALARLLESLGHAVSTSRSAEDAMALLEGCQALVTDIRLPGLDGIELAETFLRGRNSARVVFVTGGCPADRRKRALELGPVLQKPVRREDLQREFPTAPATGDPAASN